MKTVMLQANKVSLVWSTDWHLSAIPPGRRADDYQAAILGKLEFIRSVTERAHGVALCGGDVFHIKSPKSASNSLNMLIEALHCLRRFPTGMVYGSVGNHDLGYGERMDSLAGQPLGLLVAAGAYHNLSAEPAMFYGTEKKPSASSISHMVRVQVESFPYGNAEETLKRILSSKRHHDATHRVGIVHWYGEPRDGGEFWGEKTIGYDQVGGTDFDFLLWGHDHSRKETQKVGNVTNVHLGSLARAALDTDQAERPVACAVLSFSNEGTGYEEVEVPVKPLEAAFVSADRGVRTLSKSQDIKDFLAKMDEAVEGIEVSDPAEALRALCPDDPPLLALVKELCGL